MRFAYFKKKYKNVLKKTIIKKYKYFYSIEKFENFHVIIMTKYNNKFNKKQDFSYQ